MTDAIAPRSSAADPRRPVAGAQHWDRAGSPVEQLIAELANAREALMTGREAEAARLTAKLLAKITAALASRVPESEQPRLRLLEASAMTVIGCALLPIDRGAAHQAFEAAADRFETADLSRSNVDLPALADYGTALAELDRTDEAVDAVIRALERRLPVPVDVVLRIADASASGKGSAEQGTLRGAGSGQRRRGELLSAAWEAGLVDPRLAERLAEVERDNDRPAGAAAWYDEAGTGYMGQGRLEEALRCFDLAVALAPEHPDPRTGRAYVLAQLDRPEEALPAAQDVVARDPEQHRARALAAQLMALDGRPDEALRYLEPGLAHPPVDPELLEARARVLAMEGRWSEARDAVSEARELWPAHADLRRLDAQLLALQNQYEAAIEVLRGLVADGAADRDDRLQVIQLMANLGAFERALAETDNALLSHPRWVPLITARALLLNELGRPQEALGAAQQALALDDSWAPAVDAEAEALERLGRPEETLSLRRRLVDLLPDDPDARAALAGLLIERGDYTEAAAVAQAGVAQHPDDLVFPALLGRALMLAGRFEDARPPLEEAVRRSEESIEAADRGMSERVRKATAQTHADLGQTLRLLGDPAAARPQLDRALELDGDNPYFLANQGQVLAELDDPDAEKLLREALKQDDKLGWIHAELGDLLRRRDRSAEALASLTRAIQLDPENSWAWACRGATEHGLGEYEAALVSLDQALRLDPEYAWAWALRGSVLMDIDRPTEAEAAFGRAVELEGSERGSPLGWAWTALGWLFEVLGRRTEAGERFLTALEADEDEIWAEIGLADLLLQEGAAEAEPRFRAVLARVPGTDMMELAELGWCHLRLGEFAQASREFAEALLLDEEVHALHFDLALALLGTGPAERALATYEQAAAKVRAVPHDGRRRSLFRVADHDLSVVLAQPGFAAPEVPTLAAIRALLRPDGAGKREPDRTVTGGTS
ncbi:tetratricopeptide repeat protein [Kitasatospora sp. NPDC059408]|uniref:tetratricopeptide repeat protein n=1 Tax=Kitasatospora sp. NPDC059408 TaxID=3346823 RepID=UPI0036769411